VNGTIISNTTVTEMDIFSNHIMWLKEKGENETEKQCLHKEGGVFPL
jgi:hypothetical protein